MNRIAIESPLRGWVCALDQVCDEVFSSGLAGDGLAIEPLAGELHAPADGEIVLPGDAMHAVSLRLQDGVELLIHVGIDTVALRGAGFERLVRAGQRVSRGDVLLRFDLDRIAREARSAITPILLASGGRILQRAPEGAIAPGDALFEIEVDAASATDSADRGELVRTFRVPFEHGLHARPAAQIVAALRAFPAEVTIVAGGRRASARSTVALMGLGLQRGDGIEVVARGDGAGDALDALAAWLAPVVVIPQSAVPAPVRLEPIALAREFAATVGVAGLASGTIVRFETQVVDSPEHEAGRGAATESTNLDAALARVDAELGILAERTSGAQREVLEAHRELIRDPELRRHADLEIGRGRSAARAWRSATQAIVDVFAGGGDARIAERGADLRDLEQQVLRALAGESPLQPRELPESAIVVADELLPSQLAALDQDRLAGICMARGGTSSHVVLLAAARGVPTLLGAGPDLLAVPGGTSALLDAESGRLRLDPSREEIDALRRRLAQRAAREAADLAAAAQPAQTRDGQRVAVLANIGDVAEAGPAVARGAEGCGLLRTELMFLDRRAAPDVAEQSRLYGAIAATFAPRPLTIRTLDVGGDKPLAYLPLPREDNPALGLRGLRVGLRSPELLRQQFDAILAAAPQGRVRILLPMVNDLAELRSARDLLSERARANGIASLPPLGVMIETPAAAMLADQLAREADFLSIGSNDLGQYVLAIDRTHAELGRDADALHPAVLRLIARVADAGRANSCSVSLCGGLASQAEAVPLLLGLGLRELSVAPAALPRVKRRIRDCSIPECEALARRALDADGVVAVRALLAEAATSSVPHQAEVVA